MLESTKASMVIGTALLRISILLPVLLCFPALNQATACVDLGCALLPSGIVARFFQKVSNDSTPPNKVVKIVESASKMCPARCVVGGIQMHELNSVFPESMNGC